MASSLIVAPAPIGSPEFEADPYPTYAYLRALGPVQRDENAPIWHVVGYQEVQAALRDPRLAADRTGWLLSAEQRCVHAALASALPDMMVFTDPPRHTRLRGLATRAFTPRVVAGLRERVQAVVDDLLFRAETHGACDVIADLAVPLPVLIIAELLGVPEADRSKLKAWSDDFAAFIGGPIAPDGVARADAAIREMSDYFRQLVAHLRRAPGENLISALIAAQELDDALTPPELLATRVILLVGGHETTTNLIGNGLLALLLHPDQMEHLRSDPTLIGPAIEELLRYDSPAQMTTRLASQDMTIGDVRIGEGELVKLWLGSANRDPSQFLNPDCLDLARIENRHLSFGYGIHFCVGAALARLEGAVALSTLVARYPNLALIDEPLAYHGTQVFRALKRLPVSLQAPS